MSPMFRIEDEAEPSTAKDEAFLLHELVHGDDAVAEEFARNHTPWMTAYALRLLGDPTVAEDCVQEVFFGLLREIAEADDASSIQSWLHQLVANQAMTKLGVNRQRDVLPSDECTPVSDLCGRHVETSTRKPSTLQWRCGTRTGAR